MRKQVSLVAGNVTGGGGKATTTKTYRHGVSRETQQDVETVKCENRLCADRKDARREHFSGYKKIGESNVYMRD